MFVLGELDREVYQRLSSVVWKQSLSKLTVSGSFCCDNWRRPVSWYYTILLEMYTCVQQYVAQYKAAYTRSFTHFDGGLITWLSLLQYKYPTLYLQAFLSATLGGHIEWMTLLSRAVLYIGQTNAAVPGTLKMPASQSRPWLRTPSRLNALCPPSTVSSCPASRTWSTPAWDNRGGHPFMSRNKAKKKRKNKQADEWGTWGETHRTLHANGREACLYTWSCTPGRNAVSQP